MLQDTPIGAQRGKMAKFKKCNICKGIASFKVWFRDTKTNEKFVGRFCNICWEEVKTDSSKGENVEFQCLDLSGYKEEEHDGYTLMNPTRIQKI